MSAASRHAYDLIIPQLPAREAAVLGVLLKNAEAPGYPRSIRVGPHGMTNREIAHALGLERDSVSPRTARLRQKGLICEAGIKGKETVYEIRHEPLLANLPRAKSAQYIKGAKDAIACVNRMVSIYGNDEAKRSAMVNVANVIERELLQ